MNIKKRSKVAVCFITTFMLLLSTFVGSYTTAEAASGYNIPLASNADGWDCGIDFSNGNIQSNGIELVVDDNVNAEAYTYVKQTSGSQGRMIPAGKYAYFKADDSVITQNDSNLVVEITYFSEVSTTATLHYNTYYDNTNVSNYKSANFPVTGGSWSTTVLGLSDVCFRNKQNNGADFRIAGELMIRSIKIKKAVLNPDTEPIGARTNGSSYSEFTGKTCTGYQAWFTTADRYNRWVHWGSNAVEADGTMWPRANNITFDIYPDVSEYDESSLAQTGFANLGSGEPAKLFNSSAKDVIDTHFNWMQTYGIDGAAVQRFVNGLKGRSINLSETDTLSNIRNAAEDTERIFYIMYDISGGDESSYVDDIKFDWVYNIEQSHELTNSPSYATVNGKPVVCLWGLGVQDRPTDAGNYQKLINFFRDRDCYIILGTGSDWRGQNQYIEIYKQGDMITPWCVGGFGGTGDGENFYRNNIEPDFQYCKENGLDYYPVVWSGFSWALWNGLQPNYIKRNQGELFWFQAKKLREMGVESFYIAMFDEYDEGTAIMKNASDYFDIPTDQYFVTASADGYWLSSDFQLRVAQAAIEMIKKQRDYTDKVPVPHSNGPIYYRNSFESRYVTCADSSKNGVYPIDPCFKNPIALIENNISNQSTAMQSVNNAKNGEYVTAFSGNFNATGAEYRYKIADTKIKVSQDMVLSYAFLPLNNLGQNTQVNLLFDDGTYLQAIDNAKDAKGTVNEWTTIKVQIDGHAYNGKSIVGVVIEGKATAEGGFSAYFDDVIIENGTLPKEEGSDITADIYFDAKTNPITQKGIELFSIADEFHEAYTCQTTISGQNGLRIPIEKYAYFKVDDSLISSTDQHLRITLTYYGGEADNFHFQYNGLDNKEDNYRYRDEIVAKKLTGNWESVTFTVNDAAFNNEQNNGADFRIIGNNTIQSIIIEKITDYTVNFDANGGKVETTTKEVECGAAYGELPVATREGYTFLGWFTDKNGGSKVTPATVCESDIMLYAQWERISYDVVFDLNGGSSEDVSLYNQQIEHGEFLVEPVEPTKEDFVFEGWYTEADEKFNFATPITSEITLIAKWTKMESDITADIYFDAGASPIAQKGIQLVVAADEFSEAYTYQTTIGGQNGLKIPIDKYAYFKVDDSLISSTDQQLRITITYYGGEADNFHFQYNAIDDGANTSRYKDEIVAKEWTGNWETVTFVLDDASFRNAQNNSADFRINGNNTIQSIIIEKITDYTVNFDANGGEVDTTTKELKSGDTYGELPVATREGYTFLGWYTDRNGGSKVTSATVCEGDITLYAQWERISYDVVFDLNGGSSEDVSLYNQQIEHGEFLVVPVEPTKEDFVFEGWYTEADEKFDFATPITSEITLIAKWIKMESDITADIYFDAGLSPIVGQGIELVVSGDENNEAYTYQTTIAGERGLKIPVDKYAYFKVDDSLVSSSDQYLRITITYYGAEADNFHFQYNAIDDGANTSRYKDEIVAKKWTGSWETVTFTLDDASFRNAQNNAADFRIIGNNTIQSIIIEKLPTYTVNFDANGGGVATESKKVKTDDAYGELPVATREGHTFLGWYTGKTDGQKVTFESICSEDITLYAHWKKINYDVIFDADGGSSEDTSLYSQEVEYMDCAVEPAEPTKEGFVFEGWYTEDGEKFDFATPITSELNLTAKWTEIPSYTVTFDANGGQVATESKEIKEGEPYGDLPEATREGYTFLGWYTAASDGEKVTGESICEKDIILYAHWEKMSYDVTFDANGGISEDTTLYRQEIEYKECAVEPEAPTKDGFVFEGWYTEDGEKFDFATPITSDLNLTAKWTEISSCTVTFDANGGEVETTTKELESGDAYGELPVATREGYTFLGWFTGKTDGDKITAESICEGDITLYAQWEKMRYDVVFDADGGSCEDISLYSQEVEYKDCAVEPAEPTKEGFVFEGWYTKDGDKFDFSTTITSDLNLIAKWKELENDITEDIYFDAKTNSIRQNGIELFVSTDENSEPYTYQTTINGEGGIAIPDGKYAYFNVDDSLISSADQHLRITITYYGAEADCIHFQYNSIDDGTNATKYKDEIVAKEWTGNWETVTFVLDDASFRNAQNNSADFRIMGINTIQSIVIEKIKDYTVTFDANGGEVETSTKELESGAAYGDLPVATRDGHTFLGWYTGKTDGEKIISESICEGDITLYAHWEKRHYDVVFDEDGGSCEDISLYSQEIEYKECAVEPEAPTKDGFVFEGWYTEAGEKFDFATPITSDLNLTAKWTEISSYTVTFDANGGQVATESKEIKDGEPYGDLPEATREGHTFLGWYTAVSDGEKVTAESICEKDIILYAHWEKMSYDVIFDANGGISEDTTLYRQEVEYMDCAVEPAEPTKEGFVFEGWYTEAGEKFDFSTSITSALRLSAKWTEIESDRLSSPIANLTNNSEVMLGTLLTLSCDDEDAKIYYTLDGSEPTENAFLYTHPITLWKNVTVKAIVVREGYQNSEVTEFIFMVANEDVSEMEKDMPADWVVPNGIWFAGIKDASYTGSKIKQSFRVYDGAKLLAEKKDYTVTYKNNKNAYTYTDEDYSAFEELLKETGKRKTVGTFNPKKAPQVIVTMKGNYSGKQIVYFRIEPQNIAEVSLETMELSATYNGQKKVPKPTLTFNGKKLVYGTDFYVKEYEDAKNDKKAFSETGEYDLKVVGKKNYTGEVPVSLRISESAKQIAINKVTVQGIKNMPWTGEQLTQTDFTVKYKKDILSVENGDYTVKWGVNKDVGKATLTLIGTGLDEDEDGFSYIGTKTVSFKITGTSMSKITVSGVENSYSYTGSAIEPIATLLYKENTLDKDKHYTVDYQKNVEKGTATIIFTGLESGGYTGTKKHTFRIDSAPIGDITEGETTIEQIDIAFKDVANMQGNVYVAPYMKGGAKPEVIVTSGKTVLEFGRDYTVSYSNNKKVALSTDEKAPTLTVKGKGNYSGSKSVTFSIAAKALSNECGITVVAKDKVENAKKNGYRQSFKLYDANGKKLENKDFDSGTATYTLIQTVDENGVVHNVNQNLDKNSVVYAGSVIKITVQGKGVYAGGEATGTYRILDKGHDISKATIKLVNQFYTGKPLEITDQSQFKTGKVFVKINGEKKELILGRDIEVVPGSYVKNIAKGTAKVTFRGINDFGGTKTVSFKIQSRSVEEFWEGVFAKTMELFG